MQTSFRKLGRAVELGFQRMETMRRARFKFLAQYVGPFYSKTKDGADQEDRKASPVNLMYSAVTTLVPNLVYSAPKVKVRTEILPYRPYAQSLELATNHLIRRINLELTLRKTITDGLFGPGVIKTGLAVNGQTLDLEGKTYNIGAPYADRVDPDDLVVDPMARDWHELKFIGNRFRIPKDTLINSGMFPGNMVDKLMSRLDVPKGRNEAAYLFGDAMTLNAYDSDVMEYVDLVELYMPDEGTIVTMPYGVWDTDQPLRVVEYDGPATGPYHMLGFAYAPDNVFPVPPASIWYYLHIMANRIARKITRQAERMKNVLAYEPAAVDDANEIADADDGETVAVEDVTRLKELSFGGTTDKAYEYMEWVTAEFSKQAGNIELLAGTNDGADTATQSQMLQANSNVRLQDMQNLVYDFTAEVARDLAFYIHTDPLIEMPLATRIGGQDVQVVYTPEMRKGDFFDYAMDVQPYSMTRQDPAVKLRRILEFVSTNLPAIAQTAQILGPMFNVEGTINLVARELGIEETDQIIVSGMWQQHVQSMMQQGPQPDGHLAAGTPGAYPMPGMMGGAPMQNGARPQQPNPMQMGPTGGVSPATEQRQQQQYMAGDAQRGLAA